MSNKTLTPQNSPHSISSPDNDRQVAGLVARLLLHFWAPSDLSEPARKAMAQDWVEDLREFGPEIVAQACSEYRRSESRRPAPADIRKLCVDARQEVRERDELRALAGPGAEDAYARSVGFASHAERMAEIEKHESRYRRAEDWRREARYNPADVAPTHASRFAPTAQQMGRDLAAIQRELGAEATEAATEADAEDAAQ